MKYNPKPPGQERNGSQLVTKYENNLPSYRGYGQATLHENNFPSSRGYSGNDSRLNGLNPSSPHGGISRERVFIGLPKIYERPLVQTPLHSPEGGEEEGEDEDEEGACEGEDVFE